MKPKLQLLSVTIIITPKVSNFNYLDQVLLIRDHLKDPLHGL
jgi:hypothetical protein